MHTVDEIMSKALGTNANAATAGDVLTGKVYWGLSSGAWGMITGTGTSAPVQKTGQTISYRTGDDGDLQKGATAPRFIVQSDTNVVLDNNTGLMWTRNANLLSYTNWTTAIDYCNDLTYGGYSDWRMPNILELKSLLEDLFCSGPFNGLSFQSGDYWSSTTMEGITNNVWCVDIYYSNLRSVGYLGKTSWG